MSSDIESDRRHAEDQDAEVEEPEEDEYEKPSELESALLSISMFGGLVVFGVSCTLFIW